MEYGGGVFVFNSELTFLNNKVHNNRVEIHYYRDGKVIKIYGGQGGGIYSKYSIPRYRIELFNEVTDNWPDDIKETS